MRHECRKKLHRWSKTVRDLRHNSLSVHDVTAVSIFKSLTLQETQSVYTLQKEKLVPYQFILIILTKGKKFGSSKVPCHKRVIIICFSRFHKSTFHPFSSISSGFSRGISYLLTKPTKNKSEQSVRKWTWKNC